jgi:hypothetical protein
VNSEASGFKLKFWNYGFLDVLRPEGSEKWKEVQKDCCGEQRGFGSFVGV